jgi:hypothetical protein
VRGGRVRPRSPNAIDDVFFNHLRIHGSGEGRREGGRVPTCRAVLTSE